MALMRKLQVFLGALVSICALSFVPAAADETIILVLDNSGAVQDASSGDKTRPTFLQARRAIIDQLDKRLGRKDQLIILSVNRPKIIWEGPGHKIKHRDNFVLARFLNARVNGCADFDKVARALSRTIRAVERNPSEIIFLSSLVHTGSPDTPGDPCPYDPENYAPPTSFLDALKAAQSETQAQLKLYWVDEGVINEVDDYFFSKNLPAEIKGELQTIGVLQ